MVRKKIVFEDKLDPALSSKYFFGFYHCVSAVYLVFDSNSKIFNFFNLTLENNIETLISDWTSPFNVMFIFF